jgi:transposase
MEEGIVQSISHEALRRILREKGLKWRMSRETFTSDDPEYDFKKELNFGRF